MWIEVEEKEAAGWQQVVLLEVAGEREDASRHGLGLGVDLLPW